MRCLSPDLLNEPSAIRSLCASEWELNLRRNKDKGGGGSLFVERAQETLASLWRTAIWHGEASPFTSAS